jgi:hypothetical protein
MIYIPYDARPLEAKTLARKIVSSYPVLSCFDRARCHASVVLGTALSCD